MLEDGYNGLTTLSYAKLEWGDAEVGAIAETLAQLSCPNLTKVDLSWNAFTGAGLEPLGEAIAAGSLHALKRLDLSNCMRLSSLPPKLGGLTELEVLDVSGCVGLANVPPAFTGLVSLQEFRASHCHLLRESGFEKRLPKTTKVVRED